MSMKKKIETTDAPKFEAPASVTVGLGSESIVTVHTVIKPKIVKGADLTDAEFDATKELILKNGTVKVDLVGDRIRRAELIGLAKHDGHTFGTLALRVNKREYMQKLIGRSRVSGLPHDSLELSWLRLKPSKLGQGVERLMFNALLAAKNAEGSEFIDRKIFAVYRTDDEYANQILTELGFVKHDRDHEALVGDGKRVQLWLYPERANA